LCEELGYSLLLRWLLGIQPLEHSLGPMVLTKNRQRLLDVKGATQWNAASPRGSNASATVFPYSQQPRRRGYSENTFWAITGGGPVVHRIRMVLCVSMYCAVLTLSVGAEGSFTGIA